MKLTTKIEGIEETISKFVFLQEAVRTEIQMAMTRACYIIVIRAKEIIMENDHWVTGTLLRSIDARVGWAGMYEVDGAVGSDVHYAPYVEALPDGGYLFPAYVELKDEAFEFFKAGVRLAVLEAS